MSARYNLGADEYLKMISWAFPVSVMSLKWPFYRKLMTGQLKFAECSQMLEIRIIWYTETMMYGGCFKEPGGILTKIVIVDDALLIRMQLKKFSEEIHYLIFRRWSQIQTMWEIYTVKSLKWSCRSVLFRTCSSKQHQINSIIRTSWY